MVDYYTPVLWTRYLGYMVVVPARNGVQQCFKQIKWFGAPAWTKLLSVTVGTSTGRLSVS